MKVISMTLFSHSINMVQIAPLTVLTEEIGQSNVSMTSGTDGSQPIVTLKDMNAENPSALLDMVYKLYSAGNVRSALGDALIMSRVQIDTLEQKTFLVSLRPRSRGSVDACSIEDIVLRAVAESREPRGRSYGWRERDSRVAPGRRSSTLSPVDDMAVYLGRVVSAIWNGTNWSTDVYDPIGPVQEMLSYLRRDSRNTCRIPVAVYNADGSTTLDSFSLEVSDQTLRVRIGDTESSMVIRPDARHFLTILNQILMSYLSEGRDIVVLRSAA